MGFPASEETIRCTWSIPDTVHAVPCINITSPAAKSEEVKFAAAKPAPVRLLALWTTGDPSVNSAGSSFAPSVASCSTSAYGKAHMWSCSVQTSSRSKCWPYAPHEHHPETYYGHKITLLKAALSRLSQWRVNTLCLVDLKSTHSNDCRAHREVPCAKHAG